jgi:hypothetical protein
MSICDLLVRNPRLESRRIEELDNAREDQNKKSEEACSQGNC